AVLSNKLVKPQKGQKWILLTSAYHLPRAVSAFEKEGWQVLPVASDFFTDGAVHFMPSFNLAYQFRLIHMAAHEYVGLVGYWCMGWSNRPW
ncbi:MAG: YdcF family protein, partial [Bdellovibrionales bacterium]